MSCANLMSPDDAKAMACPFFYNPKDAAAHSIAGLCVADYCMAWRWTINPYLKKHGNTVDFPGEGYCALIFPNGVLP